MAQSSINRRQFCRALSTAGVSAAVLAGSSLALADDAPSAYAVGDANVNFTRSVDILICGAGIAGMMAGLETARAGLSTLMVDQNGFAGGDAIYSAACMICMTAELTKEERPEVYRDMDTIRAKAKEMYPDDPVAYQKECDLKEYTGKWIDRFHYEWGYDFQPRVECPYLMAFFPKNGYSTMPDMFAIMEEKINEAGGEYLFEHTLKTLIADQDGKIIGARFVTKKGQIVDIEAKKGVVISTGGFASNQEWMTKYYPQYASLGCQVSGRTGEGIKVGMAAGAAIEGMGEYCNLNPIYECGHMVGMHYPMIALLPNGKRFYCETAVHDAGEACLASNWGMWWSIWDDTAANGYDQEIFKHASGMIKDANTLEELSEGTGINIADLQAAFDDYNHICETGEDPEFGRTLFLQPLKPPYHYVINLPVRYKSRGGLAVNEKYEVLNEEREHIPGLYACGQCAGTFDIPPAAASGMILGEALVAEFA